MPNFQSCRYLCLSLIGLLLSSCGGSPLMSSTSESKTTSTEEPSSSRVSSSTSASKSESSTTPTSSVEPPSSSEDSVSSASSIAPISPVDTVNNLFSLPYTHISVDITIGKNGSSLTSTFVGEKKENNQWDVNYAIETYNLLDIDNPDIEEKTINRGSLIYKEGQLVDSTTGEVLLNPCLLELQSLTLAQDSVNILDTSEGYIALSTPSLGSLFGSGQRSIDITILFSATSLEEVEISFLDNEGYEVLYHFYDID